jgi:hypothetical protein
MIFSFKLKISKVKTSRFNSNQEDCDINLIRMRHSHFMKVNEFKVESRNHKIDADYKLLKIIYYKILQNE